MSSYMESQVLLQSRCQTPTLQFERSPRTVCKSHKYEIVRVASLSEIFLCLRSNVEIFLPAGFLLLEHDSRVLTELLHFAPREFLNVAFTKPGKA